MNISYTYLYELINENTDEVFYIGKTNNPYKRFSGHRTSNNFKVNKFYMKIIKKYIDTEDEAINKYINEGHVLVNKRKNDYIKQEYEINQVISHDPYYTIKKLLNNK
jgi:predicted GIY-YIG superfamily endonuclease